MKTISIYISLLLVCISIQAVYSQVVSTDRQAAQLRGVVLDSLTNSPIPFASLAVVSAEGKVLMGTTADEEGKFLLTLNSIPADSYTVLVSFMGYETQKIESLAIPESDGPLTIKLAQSTLALKEITITGRKPVYEDKGDRLVYNAEQDIGNAGGTAADVLQKAPLLTVDLEGNVQLRGSSAIRVLLNGKPSGIMARNVAVALRQIPAATIKSVEVITSPGAKYDAEGTTGVINIITKKKIEGLDGTSYATLGNMTQAAGINLSLQREKFGIALAGNYYRYRSLSSDEYRRENLSEGQVASTLTQRIEKENIGQGGNVELILDYNPDSTEHYSVWLGAWRGYTPDNGLLFNRNISPLGQVYNEYSIANQVKSFYTTTELNLGYTKTYPRAKSAVVVSPRSFRTMVVEELKEIPEWSIFGQYNTTPDSLYYLSAQSDPAERLISQERSFNNSTFRELTLQTDYVRPFTLGFLRKPNLANFSIGGKSIARSMASNFVIEEAVGESNHFVEDAARSNQFGYEQRILAGYAAFWLRSRTNWTVNAGGRVESTSIRGNVISLKSGFENSYVTIIPNVTLARSFEKAGTFKVSYTQRIFRPQIGYLNPFINYSDPNNLSTGNPYLSPELTHAFEASHSLFSPVGISLTTSAFHHKTTDAVEYIREVNPLGVSLLKPYNIAYRFQYGVGVHGSVRTAKSWNLTVGGNWHYQNYLGVQGAENAGYVWNAMATGSLKAGESTSFQINGNYANGKVTFQGRYSAYYAYGFSIRQDFWDSRANLTLSVNNPFQWGVVQKSEFMAPDFRAENTSLIVSRWARLTFYWHFLRNSEMRWRENRKVSHDDKIQENR